jgi:hypothetical protein
MGGWRFTVDPRCYSQHAHEPLCRKASRANQTSSHNVRFNWGTGCPSQPWVSHGVVKGVAQGKGEGTIGVPGGCQAPHHPPMHGTYHLVCVQAALFID